METVALELKPSEVWNIKTALEFALVNCTEDNGVHDMILETYQQFVRLWDEIPEEAKLDALVAVAEYL